MALMLFTTAGCETVFIDGLAKKRLHREYGGWQKYPPKFAPYDEPFFNYEVRWDQKAGRVHVRLHPVKSVRWSIDPSAITELSHSEMAAACANCHGEISMAPIRHRSGVFVFDIPKDAPFQDNQIYYFKLHFSDDGGADQEELLFFYNQQFYPKLIRHYESRRAKIRRLANSKEYKINNGDHEPTKIIIKNNPPRE